ncbi:hypothetical protein [Dolichospermum compactum]|nr:hypothetical protein [Dolichospermum compactum]
MVAVVGAIALVRCILGATLTNYIGIKPLILAVFGGAGTTLESLLSVTLILRLTRTNYFLNQVNSVAIFSFCSLLTGTVLQFLIGVMAVCLGV